MDFAIFQEPVTTIYGVPAYSEQTEKGLVSPISDEGLYGFPCRILEEKADGWARIMTHYGYIGFVREKFLIRISESALAARRARPLYTVNALCADVCSIPSAHGLCLASLMGGSVIEVIPGACDAAGWTKVHLLDGREGYLRTQVLEEKRWGDEMLWDDADAAARIQAGAGQAARSSLGGRNGFSLGTVLEKWYGGSEEAFREELISRASGYLGVQYRWGGKSHRGIDCSGLASMSYMRSGVLIWRDASIVDGFPIRCLFRYEPLWEGPDGTPRGVPKEEIPNPIRESDWRQWKKGDLLYFPGHVALYLGEGRYIHSTGHIGSGGVVVNSLRREDEDYREDLPGMLYAVGGVRCGE